MEGKTKICFGLAFMATCLTFLVILLGVYTRLTDAGLGCPDWPGCYGHWFISNTVDNLPASFMASKAWTEMIHRYIAGTLGLIITTLFLVSFCNFRHKEQPLMLPLFLFFLVIFQGLLGKWTVTLKLYPLVVMTHLLGGFTTLALLWWLTLMIAPTIPLISINLFKDSSFKIVRFWSVLGLVVIILQLFLGGWTSANYAALVCLDFPFCQLAPFSYDFQSAFNLTSAGVTGSMGEPLNGPARMTIHMVHRFGAILTLLSIGWLSFLIITRSQSIFLKNLGKLIISLLGLQILLGISNVLYLLPLPIAIAHTAMGALLLLSVLTLNYILFQRVYSKESDENI